MSTHNICFHGEIRKKIIYFLVEKSALSRAMNLSGVSIHHNTFILAQIGMHICVV